MQKEIAGRDWQQKALSVLQQKIEDKQDRALIVACPGAGKTRMAIAFGKELLERDTIDFIIVIAPSDGLRTQWTKEIVEISGGAIKALSASYPLPKDELKGMIEAVQARIYTFQSIEPYQKELKQIEQSKRVLLIVDEGHHAGAELPWSKGLIKALSAAKFKLVLSGTPWRSDRREMPFVSYDDNGNALADYAYTRRQGLIDKVVREAVVVPVNAMIEGEGEEQILHPITGKTIQIKPWTVEGRISAWDYGLDPEAMRKMTSAVHKNLNPEEMVETLRSTLERKGMSEEEILAEATRKSAELGSRLQEDFDPDKLADPELLLALILRGRKNVDIPPEEAEKMVKESGIMGIRSDPALIMRKMWDKGESYSQMFLLHEPGIKENRRYRLAIDTNVSQASRAVLEEAHRKLMELRDPKGKHPDERAGGLVVCENKASAKAAVTLLESITGERPRLVLSDVELAKDQIADFRESDEKWVVTVKMISEGVDIKRLRVLAYLSNVMSELFLAQVLGRITRWREDISQEEQTAYFYALAYPPLLDAMRLVDGKVLTQCANPLSLPELPPMLIQCTPVSKKEGAEDIKGCKHLNWGTHHHCKQCGAPLKLLRRRSALIDASEIERSGTLWRGTYAEESYVEFGEWIKSEDDLLDGVSEQLIAVIAKHAKMMEFKSIWKRKEEECTT